MDGVVGTIGIESTGCPDIYDTSATVVSSLSPAESIM